MTNALLRRLGFDNAPQEVKLGCSYRRMREDSQSDTATVLDLRLDLLGIPHVRFAVAFDRSYQGRIEGGQRILALRSFVATYPEQVS